jgi:hypothetical protein
VSAEPSGQEEREGAHSVTHGLFAAVAEQARATKSRLPCGDTFHLSLHSVTILGREGPSLLPLNQAGVSFNRTRGVGM